MSEVSIVIPTYNRCEQISNVIDHLLNSDTESLTAIEIIVVDDGSVTPAKSVVESINTKTPFNLRYLYQTNAGPAEARNNGFRHASHEIVLFIDDDILVFPDLIKKHVAAHQKYKGSVIFGLSPLVPPNPSTPSYRYLEHLVEKEMPLPIAEETDFVKVQTVASGNLSVEKSMFADFGGVYGRNLKIPSGEEFELAFRLAERGIPIYVGLTIKALHLQGASVADKCNQEYKYGLGIAEVSLKNPSALKLEALRNMFALNNQINKQDAALVKVKKILRKPLAAHYSRQALLKIVQMLESVAMPDNILFPLYRMLFGTYFYAGIQSGLRRFKNNQNAF